MKCCQALLWHDSECKVWALFSNHEIVIREYIAEVSLANGLTADRDFVFSFYFARHLQAKIIYQSVLSFPRMLTTF